MITHFLKTYLQLFSILQLYAAQGSYPNVTWQLGGSTMPLNRYSMAAIYSHDADCILLFGGDQTTSNIENDNVWCYHINNDTFTTYDTLTLSDGFSNQEGNSIFKINDTNDNEIIYMWHGVQLDLIKYNVLHKNASIITSNSDTGGSTAANRKYGCMAKHPVYDDIIYYGIFIDSDTFYSYNITNDTWITLTSTNEDHFKPGCIVVDSILYIIGGSTYNIEKIDLLNINSGWNYTNSSLQDINSATSINYLNARIMTTISFEHFIFIIGGTDSGSNGETDIIVFDTKLDKFYYVGDLNYDEWAAANAFYNNTFYLFGGYSSGYINTFLKSNYVDYIPPTKLPTTIPTAMPTIIPSINPSKIPTSIPTAIPTTIPTTNPSTIPTTNPTMNPSVIPTSMPTFLPTAAPVDIWEYFNDTVLPSMIDYVISDSVNQLVNVSEIGVTTILDFAESHAGLIDTETESSVDSAINIIYGLVSLQEDMLVRLVNYTNAYVNDYWIKDNGTKFVGNINGNCSSCFEDTVLLLSSIAESSFLLLDTYFEAAETNGTNYGLEDYLPTCCVYNESMIFDILSLLDNIINSEGYYDYIVNILEKSEDDISNDTLTLYLFEILSNTVSLMSYSDFSEFSNILFGNALIQWINDIGNLLLLNKSVNTTFEFLLYNSFDIKFSKIDIFNYDTCQIDNNLLLSNELLEIKSNLGNNTMNCILMTTYYNIYNISSTLSLTNFLSFDLHNDENVDDFNVTSPEYVWLSDCEPIIITYNSSNYNQTWWDNNNYPVCSFYNVTTDRYESDGCYVISTDIDSSIVQCGCLHNTFFNLQWSDFKPEINYEAIYITDDITISLLFEHPLGLIVSLLWVLIMIGLMLLFEKVIYPKNILKNPDDKPLVAIKSLALMNVDKMEIEKDIEKDIDDNGDLKRSLSQDYRSVIEYKLYVNKEMSIYKKLFYLWWLHFRNDHIWGGIFFRQKGTHYTTIQRISVLCMRLLITMAISALFFGINRTSFVGDWSLALYETLFAWIPVYLISRCIKKRKPNERDIGIKVKKEYSLVLRQLSKLTKSNSNSKSTKSLKSLKSKAEAPAKSKSKSVELTSAAIVNTTTEQASDIAGDKTSTATDELEAPGSPGSLTETTMMEKDEITLLREHIELRSEIIDNTYSLNGYWKYIAYFCIVILSLVCIIITCIWCVYFDVTYLEVTNNYTSDIENSVCLNQSKIDISEIIWLNYNATQLYILNNLTMDNDWYVNALSVNNENGNSFGDNLSTSDRFLLELLICHLLSVFLYSPLRWIIYPILTNYIRFLKNPDKMTEGNYFSKHNQFPAISTMLEQDAVDAQGKTLRVHSLSADHEMQDNQFID